MTDNNTGNNIAFDAIKIGMASPEQIREWSYGEVKKPEFETRPIIQVIDAEPVLIEQQLRLWQWISTYYMSPIEIGRASCRERV